MLKKQAAENVEAQKTAMIAAMYANGNIGGDDLTKAIESVEDHYKKAIELIYPRPGAEAARRRQAREPDWSNPFWAGAAASYARQREALDRMRATGDPRATVADVAKLEDKRAERAHMYDQTAPKK